MMKASLDQRPSTTVQYRNKSSIFANQQISNDTSNNEPNKKLKTRPKSYRNFSRVGEFMNDFPSTIKENKQVHYVNNIQNSDKFFYVPQRRQSQNPQKQHKFEQFMQSNCNKMYKPTQQFTVYSDLMSKNSSLLRRGQFNIPLGKDDFSVFKRSQKQSDKSRLNTRYNTTGFIGGGFTKSTNVKLCNTISQSFQKSIKDKKELRKQSKQYFKYKRHKHIKAVAKTFMDHIQGYDSLIQKQRNPQDEIVLKNAMNRILTMQAMGKKMLSLGTNHA